MGVGGENVAGGGITGDQAGQRRRRTHIEHHAIGGGGNDTLIANDLGCTLIGGAATGRSRGTDARRRSRSLRR